MQTAGQFTQDTPFADAQVLIAGSAFTSTAGTVGAAAFTAITGTGGTINLFGVPSSSTGVSTREVNVTNRLLRTGNFAPSTPTTLNNQAFGTAALLPGPQAAVPATSSPLGIGVSSSYPPVTKANLPTLIGSVAGAKPKGLQINWVDILYITTASVVSITVTLKHCAIPLGAGTVVPVVITDMNAVAAPNPPFAITSANALGRVRCVNPAPVMLVGDTTLIDLAYSYNIASGVFTNMGVVLGCSYNYN